ncbi:uncharacterized protein LOC116612317 [Nematostella vectensis]|uniref:uncharacterized protein LOC116612317 n=1 Tax=Nematostella vectensis TaxID=45351 RepID=UPI00207790B7|nr:uncharacterized protein LOC116612317 [Nematostella vectensis]
MKALSILALVFFILKNHGGQAGEGCDRIGLDSMELFPDHYLTSPSSLGQSHAPPFARPSSPTSWQPAQQSYDRDYLLVDLGVVHHLCSIATAGDERGGRWTRTYKIALSDDNVKWSMYRDQGGDKIFHGNSDGRKFVRNNLKAIARFIRVLPQTYHVTKALRIELYGKRTDKCGLPLGLENYGISDSQLRTIYSDDGIADRYSDKRGPYSSRLHAPHAYRAVLHPVHTVYLQVDLLQPKTVTGVATQGDPEEPMWVTSYSVEYALESGTSFMYTTSDKKVFQGNKDGTSVVVNWFEDELVLRFFRILPKTSHRGISLRMELYGCSESPCERQLIKPDAPPTEWLTATSVLEQNSTLPSHGRLEFQGGHSWCAYQGDWDGYLQVDLLKSHVVCAVVTQGDSKADQWVPRYRVQHSTDNKKWNFYYPDRYYISGNFDRNTMVARALYEQGSAVARGMRFVVGGFHKAPCMRVGVYGTSVDVCRNSSVGVSAMGAIPEYRFTASSYKDAYKPPYGRAQGARCWCAASYDDNEFLQVDLGTPHTVCAVGTQGCPGTTSWSRSYRLSFSMTGILYDFYKDQRGNNQVFQGPMNDQEPIVKQSLPIPRLTKFVRFHPLSYNNNKCLRVEVYGVPQVMRQSLGLEAPFGVSTIPDTRLTASSVLSGSYPEASARLYAPSAWCAKDTLNPFLEVDLGEPKTIFGFAWQGEPGGKGFVTSFDVQYSYTSDLWREMRGFQGNTDGNGVMARWMNGEPIGARYFRFLPKMWQGQICMRVDLYGSDKAPPPKVQGTGIKGTLRDSDGSHLDLTCEAVGDSSLTFKWYETSRDITSKSRGVVCSRGVVQGYLRVNFTSAYDFYQRFGCQRISAVMLRCVVKHSCCPYFAEVRGEEYVFSSVLFIDIPESGIPTPTQFPHSSTPYQIPDIYKDTESSVGRNISQLICPFVTFFVVLCLVL